jgi:hypothetical protein
MKMSPAPAGLKAWHTNEAAELLPSWLRLMSGAGVVWAQLAEISLCRLSHRSASTIEQTRTRAPIYKTETTEKINLASQNQSFDGGS